MSLSFQDSLASLGRLSAASLDMTSRRIRKSLADAEWKMSICLLAMVRTGGFRELGYATITEYGERVLNLSGKKLDWLLGTARALEHLPLLSRAFQDGKIGWGKVRALQTLATPETEQAWLEYALAHSTAEVAGKVSMSPAQWKRQRALEASLRRAPLATVAEVKEVLRATEAVTDAQSGESRTSIATVGGQSDPMRESEAVVVATNPRGDEAGVAGSGSKSGARTSSSPAVGHQAVETGPGSESVSQTNPSAGGCQEGEPGHELESVSQTINPQPPAATLEEPPSQAAPPASAPQTIRLVVELTPDQYALYEAAETRVRARAGKRVAKGEVLAQMAESVLDQGTARARARHQVLIHTCESCRHAWYDNDRGVMPVGREVLEEALRTVTPIKVESLTSSSKLHPCSEPPIGRDSCRVSLPRGKSDKSGGLSLSDSLETPGALSPSDSSETPGGLKPSDSSETPGDLRPSYSSETPVGLKSSTSSVAPSDREIPTCPKPSTSLESPSPLQLSGAPDSPLSIRTNNPRESEVVDIGANPSEEQNPPGEFEPTVSLNVREYIPNATLRALFARARNCCERCGARGRRLDIHHTDPVCEGGGSSLEDLRLYCRACHTLHHQTDLEEKPWWRNARREAMEKAARRGGP